MLSKQAAIQSEQKIGEIPVRNLWLFMLYASDLYRELGIQFSSVEEAPDEIPDLIAKMMCSATEKRIRRNLSFGYRQRQDHLNRLRGKINFLETERHNLLAKGKIACRFEELTVDTPRNRYIKAALEKLGAIVRNATLSHECRAHAKQLQLMGVKGTKPNAALLSKETFGRHDRDDRQLISLAHLAFELVLPSELSGSHHIQSPDRNMVFVRKLFEKGLAGLYKTALAAKGWEVTAGRKLKWQIGSKSEGIHCILPSMTTDIELENDEQHIIIDTKFNSILTKGWYRDQTLGSGYIYQMYAYLRSQERSELSKSMASTGILLHPCVGQPVNETVVIQGHPIKFITVDLTSSALNIHSNLLEVIDGE